jgi:hypothetical protein
VRDFSAACWQLKQTASKGTRETARLLSAAIRSLSSLAQPSLHTTLPTYTSFPSAITLATKELGALTPDSTSRGGVDEDVHGERIVIEQGVELSAPLVVGQSGIRNREERPGGPSALVL